MQIHANFRSLQVHRVIEFRGRSRPGEKSIVNRRQRRRGPLSWPGILLIGSCLGLAGCSQYESDRHSTSSRYPDFTPAKTDSPGAFSRAEVRSSLTGTWTSPWYEVHGFAPGPWQTGRPVDRLEPAVSRPGNSGSSWSASRRIRFQWDESGPAKHINGGSLKIEVQTEEGKIASRRFPSWLQPAKEGWTLRGSLTGLRLERDRSPTDSVQLTGNIRNLHVGEACFFPLRLDVALRRQ